MAVSAQPQHSTISALDEDRMYAAAELILRARRECIPIHSLPEKLRPANLDEARTLQEIVAVALSPLGGWKVGASAPHATPLCSPIPLWGGYAQSGQTISRNFRRLRGVEAEIAFHLGHDLPRRPQPYTRDEVAAAIASAHPAIEILESAFVDPDQVDRLSVFADLEINGGFAWGPPCPDWMRVDLTRQAVAVYVGSEARCNAIASNSAGTDLLRLAVWLANHGAVRMGGLHAGDWITTGSWSGKTFAMPGQTVRASFPGFGEVTIQFE